MAYTDIDNPELYFQTKLYTGNGGTQSITLDGSKNMQPDWTWIKKRNGAADSSLMDSVRGVRKSLRSNSTAADYTESSGFSSFDSNGFSFDGTAYNHVNRSSDTFVAWNWLAGGSASSNSNGDITSSVSANTTAGFSIVSYTGTGSNATIGHGLGSAPKFIIVKNRDDGSKNWVTQITALGNNYLELNKTNATFSGSTYFNNTAPTPSVFTVGTVGSTNASSDNFIAYCFSEVKGYSKIGSYTGGSDPFVYLGFKPAWIMFKNSSASENWRIIDNKRDTDNPAAQHLYPNLANAEGSGTSYNDFVDFLSNGFKIRSGSGEIDGSGNTIIFMAFAESPFVNSNGIPNNAR
tara:strand:- start:36 stop:1082 length:1047 start_codon:yes stop_codon:yes gene_type:complete